MISKNIETSDFIERVEGEFHNIFDVDLEDWLQKSDVLAHAARHICFGEKAKRARPRLVYFFGQAVGAPEDGLADVAIAVELMHTASLLHDDVVDEGTLRRGRPTVNAQWNNNVAVLTGDLILSLALQQLQDHPPIIMKEALQVVSEMTRAAMLEVQARGSLELACSVWREIALGKTGVLFAWCGQAAALLADNMDAHKRFARCGRHLGLAFQMADDFKDLRPDHTGKNPFADIYNCNPSFPILTAVQRSESLKKRLADAWLEPALHWEEVRALGQEVLATGAAEATIAEIDRELTLALESLGAYREHPGGKEIAFWATLLWQSLGTKNTQAASPQFSSMIRQAT